MSDTWWSVLKALPPPENELQVRANYIKCRDCLGVGCEECEGKGKVRHPTHPYGPLPDNEGVRG